VEGRRAGGLVAGRRKPRRMGRPRERGNGSAQGGRGAELGLLAAREREGRGSLGPQARNSGESCFPFSFLLFVFFFYLKAFSNSFKNPF